jgi:hypothetical protein
MYQNCTALPQMRHFTPLLRDMHKKGIGNDCTLYAVMQTGLLTCSHMLGDD